MQVFGFFWFEVKVFLAIIRWAVSFFCLILCSDLRRKKQLSDLMTVGLIRQTSIKQSSAKILSLHFDWVFQVIFLIHRCAL